MRHNMPVQIERVRDLEPGALNALVAESERGRMTFVRRLADEWAAGVNRFERPGEALFVARDAGQVVGVGGLNIDPYAGDATVGRVRHLYVLTAYRRLGIGARLVAEIIETARCSFGILRLSTSNRDAARLYERLGFRPTDATKCTHVMTIGAQRERTAR